RRSGVAGHALSASGQREGPGGGLPGSGARGLARGGGGGAGGGAALSTRLGRGRRRGDAVGGGAALAGRDSAGAGRAGRRAAVPHGGGDAGQALRRVERRRGAGAADDPRLLGAVGGRELDGAVVAAKAGRGLPLARGLTRSRHGAGRSGRDRGGG